MVTPWGHWNIAFGDFIFTELGKAKWGHMQGGPNPIELVSLYEKGIRTQTHREGRLCEDSGRRRWPSTSQGGRLGRTLPTPSSWTWTWTSLSLTALRSLHFRSWGQWGAIKGFRKRNDLDICESSNYHSVAWWVADLYLPNLRHFISQLIKHPVPSRHLVHAFATLDDWRMKNTIFF